MSSSESGTIEERLMQFKKIAECIPSIKVKGASMPYLSFNGHMFSFLDKEGNMGLRLPRNERETFIREHNTRLCEAHGTILKEYVLVPEEIFLQTKMMQKYLALGFEYVSSLKPKPTKRT